jgi:hypothetical protein
VVECIVHSFRFQVSVERGAERVGEHVRIQVIERVFLCFVCAWVGGGE